MVNEECERAPRLWSWQTRLAGHLCQSHRVCPRAHQRLVFGRRSKKGPCEKVGDTLSTHPGLVSVRAFTVVPAPLFPAALGISVG